MTASFARSALRAFRGAGAWTALFLSALASAQEEADVHEEMFDSKNEPPYYPSATECAQCHPDHFREWSVSPHAYAQMSPVFNSMQATVLAIVNGTNGDFCIRCHTPVGMNRGEEVFISNIDRFATSREGITCIVCHRVKKSFGKISGRVALEAGRLGKPIYGPKGNEQFAEDFGNEIKQKLGEGKVHGETKGFFQLTTPGFCGICHDVNLVNGFRLEEAFSEYKRSPAAKKGVTCQDCHMGVEQGKFTGDKETNYEKKQIAKIGAKWVGEPRRKTDHMFPGPDHSVIHPGIFPHSADAADFASIREWLTFDYKSGWGTEEFEEEEEPDREDAGTPTAFPDRWTNIDERYEARDILFEQFELLEEYHQARKAVLQAGYGIGEVEIKRASANGIRFKVEVKNLTDGHNVPTGFISERVVYLHAQVWDDSGKLVYESGDLDPNFDVRDSHSLFVHNGELSMDADLFSLQSTFLTRNNRGSEREAVIALNFSTTPLPFLRPSRFSTVLTGQPVGSRTHRKGITPLNSKWAKYSIKKKALTGSGVYKGRVRLISGMIPVNLVDFIKGVGFDYGMSAHEVAVGVRFGVGALVDEATGEEAPRTRIAEAVDRENEASLVEIYGRAGGHIIVDEKEFEITLD